MPGQSERKPTWLRYSGLGLELASVLVGASLIGFWADRHFDSSPWGILAGFGLGLVGGLYNFIRASLRAIQAANPVGGGERASGGSSGERSPSAQARGKRSGSDVT